MSKARLSSGREYRVPVSKPAWSSSGHAAGPVGPAPAPELHVAVHDHLLRFRTPEPDPQPAPTATDEDPGFRPKVGGMRLEKLLEKFPPNEEEGKWEGHVRGVEWRLQPNSLFGRQLFVTFWIGGKACSFQGLVKGNTLHEAIWNTVAWVNQFGAEVLQLYESLAELAPPTALERVLEDDP